MAGVQPEPSPFIISRNDKSQSNGTSGLNVFQQSFPASSSLADDDHDVKMEEDDYDDDDTSDGHGSMLRNLQVGSEARDSPNDSLTTASVASSVHDMKQTENLQATIKPVVAEDPAQYLYTKTSTFKPKSSIPTRIHPSEYARQCVTAAEASRLNPFALHEDEQKLLQDKLCVQHVSVYLNIRNGILRLWTRNPSVSVNLEEAIGCVRDKRWIRLACFAWEWLVRRGYINFGCVEPPSVTRPLKGRKKESQRETIVVIGGGMAGLSTARQLTSLFHHYPDHTMPRIIVLEGRDRIGGRIYSHPLTSMRSSKLNAGQRPTAEMGAHIIIGFERGNPLDAIVRGQLALEYHLLRDLSTLYDVDGTPVNSANDLMMERLYNDILDRTGQHKIKNRFKKTAEGDREAIVAGRDPPDNEDRLTVKQYEEATKAGIIEQLITKRSRRRGAGHRAAKADNPQEQIDTNTDTKTQIPAAQAAKDYGFMLRKTTQLHETLELDELAKELNQSLGLVMDESVNQYQQFLDLKPYALRLMNWHFANLEYANAASVDRLSLRGWDVDAGGEFEGQHSQVVGGYQQVPRALWRHPSLLDVRTNKPVKSIKYSAKGASSKATIVCEDGQSFEADKVVFTAPLGVLKAQSIQFDPPLPQWKRDAIRRLGFGLLNKLVLVFERPFWDLHRDMFGLLRPPRSGNGFEQEHYHEGRGQFYLFWNTIDTSGLPVLIALMAGESAVEAERTPDAILVDECLRSLRNVYGQENVPEPRESIVTRWGSDRFARGTYSFVAKEARPADYDLLAEPIENLFFAGEATNGNYAATVHGAYLSGLRVATEVFESMVGTIPIPSVLVPPKESTANTATTATALRSSSTGNLTATTDLIDKGTHLVKASEGKDGLVMPAGTFSRPVKQKDNSLQEEWDAAMWVRIYQDLGAPPKKPVRLNVNAYLMYQMEHWDTIKTQIQEKRNTKGGRSGAKKDKHERDKVRVELGKMWNNLTEQEQQPYKDQVEENKRKNEAAAKEWQAKAAEWDRRTWEVKGEWINEGNDFETFCKRKRDESVVANGLEGGAGGGGGGGAGTDTGAGAGSGTLTTRGGTVEVEGESTYKKAKH